MANNSSREIHGKKLAENYAIFLEHLKLQIMSVIEQKDKIVHSVSFDSPRFSQNQPSDSCGKKCDYW